jgi:4-hydroxybenzoyl-CoA thioesterase
VSTLYRRAVKFEEVDAAGLVFFGWFFSWCHEAMERFFDGVPGGYVGLITGRRIGFPLVHAEADWRSPLRYGDAVEIETSITHVGTSSVRFRYVFRRAGEEARAAEAPGSSRHERDAAEVATIDLVTVATDLRTVTKTAIPDDCRALCEAHLVAPGRA